MSKPRVFLLLLAAFPFLSSAQQKNVSIRIVQDESHLLENYQTQLTLLNKAFKIQVLLEGATGVYCYASFDDSLYLLEENESLPGFEGLPQQVMAEEHFNKEKELLINEAAWSYWFYDPALNWHRFNKKIILLDGNRVVGIKSIKQFYIVDTKKEVKLKEAEMPLYLFFVVVNATDSNGKPLTELLRRKVKIEWVHED